MKLCFHVAFSFRVKLFIGRSASTGLGLIILFWAGLNLHDFDMHFIYILVLDCHHLSCLVGVGLKLSKRGLDLIELIRLPSKSLVENDSKNAFSAGREGEMDPP